MTFFWLTLVKALIPILFIVCSDTQGQKIPVADESRLSESLASGFEHRIENLFINGYIDSLVTLLPAQGRETEAYLRWFNKQSDKLQTYSLDSLSCTFPVLGFKTGSALIQNGRFELWYTEGDSSFTEYVRFREFIIEKDAGCTELIAFKPDLYTAPPEISVSGAYFNIEIAPVQKKLMVRLEYHIRNDGKIPVKVIPLNFRYPAAIRSITADGGELMGDHRYITVDDVIQHQCLVHLEEEIQNGEEINICLDYILDFRNHHLSRKQAGFNKDNGYIVFEAGWYPWLDWTFKEIPCKFKITLPEKLRAVAPGALEAIDNNGEHSTYSFSMDPQNFPFFVWGNYILRTVKINGTDLELFLLSGKERDIEAIAGCVKEIQNSLAQYLPEPEFEYQRIVEVGRYGGYGPKSNLLIESAYIDDIDNYESIELIAHELTHSWVNSLAIPSGDLNHFISEGFATYSGANAVKSILGEKYSDRLWERNAKTYQDICYKAPAPLDVNPEMMYKDNYLYRGIIYFKAAYFFRQLEDHTGSDNFRKIIETVLTGDTPEFSIRNIRKEMKKITDSDYPYLFETFLESNDLPDYFIKDWNEKDINIFTVCRKGPDCSIPLTLSAYDKEGKMIETTNVLMKDSCEKVSLSSGPETIARVTIDPSHSVLQKEIRNDIYPDCIVSADDMIIIRMLIDEAFAHLENHNTAQVMACFSDNEKYVPGQVRNAIQNAAKSWPFSDAFIESIKFFGVDNYLVESDCKVIMNQGEKKLRLPVTIKAIKGETWKLVNMSIRIQ